MKSFIYAFSGIKESLKSEHNLRIHFILAVVSICLALFLGFSSPEWAILIITIFLVISSELINTVVEKIVDIISPQISEKARIIKDISAALVLLGAFVSVIVGLCLFIPKIKVLL